MDFLECATCHQKTMARIWIKAFSSFEQAKLDGQGPEFLAALMPAAGLLKIQMCLTCQTFKPCIEFTDKETEAMKEHVKEQGERLKAVGSIGDLLGAFSKKP